MTPAVNCWHTPGVSNPGQRLDELIRASGLSRREVARRIGAARGTIPNAIERGKPPRDREQYRLLVELLGEDPFMPRVAMGDAPAVPLDELPPEQVIDLLAVLLRNPAFTAELANRLTARQPLAFGVTSDRSTASQPTEDSSGKPGSKGDEAAQA